MMLGQCDCAACRRKNLEPATEEDLKIYQQIADNFWKEKQMTTDTKLLAAQARIKELREALSNLLNVTSRDDHITDAAGDALRGKDDTAELDALIADAERYRKLRRTKAAPCDFDLSVDAMKEEK